MTAGKAVCCAFRSLDVLSMSDTAKYAQKTPTRVDMVEATVQQRNTQGRRRITVEVFFKRPKAKEVGKKANEREGKGRKGKEREGKGRRKKEKEGEGRRRKRKERESKRKGWEKDVTFNDGYLYISEPESVIRQP